MKTKLTLPLGFIFAATLAAVGVDPTPPPCVDPGFTCYEVAPSNTDLEPEVNGHQPDCPETGTARGIGCENLWTSDFGKLALNANHILYLPVDPQPDSKLLVFLGGGDGNADGPRAIYPVAASLGYHVIGLTYPAGKPGQCPHEANLEDQLACFGNMLRETVTGEEGALPGGQRTDVSDHPQDSIIKRLVRVLKWADDTYTTHGWNSYLSGDDVQWDRVVLAGWSNGSTHASYMGTMPELRGVGRVALFAGPNDGVGDSSDEWAPASFIRLIPGVTDTRYYGLVHTKNNAESDLLAANILYKVAKNWVNFGMEDPPNRPRFKFTPSESTGPDYFDGAHMLISLDRKTPARDAHPSVVKGRYCSDDPPDPEDCHDFLGDLIGYEPAWRCVLGAGDPKVSSSPFANAGRNQTLECRGNGGANAVLDGSGSRDPDCDVISETWTGPFGTLNSRNRSVFLPLGTSVVTLEVTDGWPDSSSTDTTSITVSDTEPPSIHVTLTPTRLWPANHGLVWIDATISAADSCGDAPLQVVLTSITSNQPDNGTGDGDTPVDVQEAAFDTFDTSFLLRAERAGGDPLGRTYTVTYTATDASGNSASASATVHVPHSK